MIGCAWQHQGSTHSLQRQGGDQGGRGRGVARYAAIGTLLACCPRIAWGEIHIRPALINNHKISGWPCFQLLAEGGTCGFVTLTRAERLFLRDQPSRVIARSSVARLIVWSRCWVFH